jgi:ABC-type multidrug transport system fused ATPase/permease subunit
VEIQCQSRSVNSISSHVRFLKDISFSGAGSNEDQNSRKGSHEYLQTLHRLNGAVHSFLTWNLLKRRKPNNSSIFILPTSFLKALLILLRFPETDKISPPLLQMSEVTFGYTPDKLILKGINIDVGLDSRIAIVGANGAGKSTLYVAIRVDMLVCLVVL